MNFNNLQALATAAIFATSGRCNNNESFRLENNIRSAFSTAGSQVTVNFKGISYTVTKDATGQFSLTIGE